MRNYKHRHFWRLQKRWHHPSGYLFKCNRCLNLGLYGHRLVRYELFWGEK